MGIKERDYPVMGVIKDDGAGDRDTELVVGEVLVDVVEVRAVGPERAAFVEHCIHNGGKDHGDDVGDSDGTKHHL